MRIHPFDAVAIVAAVAVKVTPVPAAWIEAHYANGAYPAVDAAVRALTGRVPFCVGDALALIAVLWLLRFLIVTVRRARRAALGATRRAGLGVKRRAALGVILRAGVRLLAVAGALFVWFVLSWAYNYARVPLADKIPVDAAKTSGTAVAALADTVVDRLSALAAPAHAETLDDAAVAAALLPTFGAAIARLGDRAAFAPPRVKPTIFQKMMELSATSGFTDPWTHEVNLDASAFAVERPAIYAHEWSHVAGFADESEANFIAAIACTTARDPLVRYSGWLLIWFNLPVDVHITHRLSRIAYADLVAIRARYLRHANPAVERVQRAAYDRYLKSNHVAAGYASYRLFIRWLTGARYDKAGLPLVRG